MITIKVKIGRNNYEIGVMDKFMDNGFCVQLLSQSKEKGNWGQRPSPVLSKRVIKEISKYPRIQFTHKYGKNVQVFRIDLCGDKK